MIDCPYFWGKITHEEAMEILEGKPTGSIILRESNPIEDDHTTRNILDVIEFIRTGNVNYRAEEKAERSQSENTSWVADNQTLFSQINKNKNHSNLQNNISYLGA